MTNIDGIECVKWMIWHKCVMKLNLYPLKTKVEQAQGNRSLRVKTDPVWLFQFKTDLDKYPESNWEPVSYILYLKFSSKVDVSYYILTSYLFCTIHSIRINDPISMPVLIFWLTFFAYTFSSSIPLAKGIIINIIYKFGTSLAISQFNFHPCFQETNWITVN